MAFSFGKYGLLLVILFLNLSTKAQHGFSYNLLNTLEYRYSFNKQESAFVGGKFMGLEFNKVIWKTGEYSAAAPITLSFVEFYTGYSRKYGREGSLRFDYTLGYSLGISHSLFDYTDWQISEPHEPYYDYNYSSSHLASIGFRCMYSVTKHFRVGSSVRLLTYVGAMFSEPRISDTGYGIIVYEQSARFSLGFCPWILGFEF